MRRHFRRRAAPPTTITVIPGTRVPDNPVNRAALWVHTQQNTDHNREPVEVDWFELIVDLERFVRLCGLEGVTPAELIEGVEFNGLHHTATLFGPIGFAPDDNSAPDVRTIVTSIWLDALKVGIALRAGKHGLSDAEIASGT